MPSAAGCRALSQHPARGGHHCSLLHMTATQGVRALSKAEAHRYLGWGSRPGRLAPPPSAYKAVCG